MLQALFLNVHASGVYLLSCVLIHKKWWTKISLLMDYQSHVVNKQCLKCLTHNKLVQLCLITTWVWKFKMLHVFVCVGFTCVEYAKICCNYELTKSDSLEASNINSSTTSLWDSMCLYKGHCFKLKRNLKELVHCYVGKNFSYYFPILMMYQICGDISIYSERAHHQHSFKLNIKNERHNILTNGYML